MNVSLIIVVNEINKLNRCISSIKKQTYVTDDIEIVCVLSDEYKEAWMNGSIISADGIVAEFVNATDCISIYINRGMEISSGKYVMIVDSDSYLDSNAISIMYDKAIEYNCDMVQCELKRTKSDDEARTRIGDDKYLELSADDSIRRGYILNHYSVSSRARMYKKSVLMDNGLLFKDAGQYSDVHFTGVLLFLLKNVYYVAEQLVFADSTHFTPVNEHTRSENCNSANEMQVIRAIDFIEEDLDRLNLLGEAKSKFIGEYQFYVAGKAYFDAKKRLNYNYEKTEAGLLVALFNRFPDIALNGYFDGLKQENNVRCVEEIRSVYYATDESYVHDPNVIHICMGLHDKYGTYSSNIGTVIHSVVKNTKSRVCFHIFIDDTVSEENKSKIMESVGESYSKVVFHLINPSDIEMKETKYYRQYTIGALFRLLIPRVLENLSKVIYFDADLLVNRDIKELWNIDISKYSIAAIHDIGFERGVTPAVPIQKGEVELQKYFNSGVLVMNLDRIREKGDLAELCFDYLEKNTDTNLPDQDALNYIFRDETLLIDKCWNTYTRYERLATHEVSNVIYHYMGEPFIFYNNPTKFDKLYIQTRAETPWGYPLVEDDLFGGLYTGYDKLDYFQKMTTAVLNGEKKRVYYGLNTKSMKNIQAMVPPKNGDYCVCHDMIDVNGMRYGMPVKEFDAIANEKKGDIVVFVLPEADGGTSLSKLNEAGFTNGVDYFVIPRLLTASQGGYIR